ncbi:MAG: GMC family oxidoreductase [Kordiimonadaceae bacterium]|nr:GMC family oxidoreductase [Kordiimonadaceae bacterium]MBT6031084.1 GMC family oxidoreductase [Kordiimonadaceae bacterium]
MASYDGFEYDVVIVGSGAGGGMGTHILTEAGIKVLLLEAGRDYDPYEETPMFNTNDEAPLRGESTSDKNFGYYDATVDGGWQVPGEPYTIGEGTEKFMWWRARMLGGRTNHFGRITPRFNARDFKPFSTDGMGTDWPMDYEEMGPWYDKCEKLIGVSGANVGSEDIPDAAEGVLQPPAKPRVYEILCEVASKKLGIPLIPMRRAVLTRAIDEREACFNATACGRGCSIGAAFQSTTSLLPWANKTGNLKIVTDAMAKTVHHDENGTATGVTFVNRKTGEDVRVDAKIVILSASTCETARIMLNSKSEMFPTGIANSSGQVGRNLMDSTGSDISGYIPALRGRPKYNEDGLSGNHIFIPWWDYEGQDNGTLPFKRGYHFEFGGGFGAPSMGIASDVDGYGKAAKDEVRFNYGSGFGMALRGEMVENENCYCEIDNEVKDKWGIPVLKFHWKWSEQEIAQTEHGMEWGAKIIEAMGGVVTSPKRTGEEAILAGGQIIHEVGTARMGDDPKTSVTNRWGQTHDVENLYIMDGSIFVSNPHKNCTLTILTLAMRNATHLAAQLNGEAS